MGDCCQRLASENITLVADGERNFPRAGAKSLFSRNPELSELVRFSRSFLVLGEGLCDAPFVKNLPRTVTGFFEAKGTDSVVRLGNIGHVSKHGPRSIA